MEDDAARPDDRGLTETAEPVLPPPPSPEEVEAAETLIRQANLAKIRGDRVSFERLVEEAAAKAPGSSAVQEALGDCLYERKQLQKAKAAYQAAVRLDPTNASAERKYGETVLAVQLALDPSFGRPVADESFASGRGAVVLSFLVPGLGQIATGETTKGYWMLGAFLVGTVLAILVPGGLAGLPGLFGKGHVSFNPTVVLPLLLCLVAWMASVSDASGKAKRLEPRKLERPVPPVDKKFEI